MVLDRLSPRAAQQLHLVHIESEGAVLYGTPSMLAHCLLRSITCPLWERTGECWRLARQQLES